MMPSKGENFTYRLKLTKIFVDQDLSLTQREEISKRMRGKTWQEKERIAKEAAEKLLQK